MHTHQKNSKRENPALSNHIFETLQHQNGTQENTRRPSGGPRASPPSLQSLQRLKVCLELMGGRAGRDRQTGGDRETDEPQTPSFTPARRTFRLSHAPDKPPRPRGECASVCQRNLWLPDLRKKKKKKKSWKNCRAGWGTCALFEGAVLSAARSCCVAKLLQVGDAVEVNKRTCDHQDVKQLVGVELEVRQKGEE